MPGEKNEFTVYLSRNVLEEKLGLDLDELTKDTFVRMDCQLDFGLQEKLFSIGQEKFPLEMDYPSSEFQEIWEKLRPYQSELIDERLFYRNDKFLFCERLIVIPDEHLKKVLLWCHVQNGHPGGEKTLLFFLRYFYSQKGKTELMKISRKLLETCEVCLRAKPNQAPDRGLMSCLPIPQMCNELLYIDFVAMDNWNGMDYVLTIVDALSRFVRFVVCNNNITGEGTLKLILSEWISVYGCPREILSDNDVRFSSEKGFYRRAFASLGIDTKFTLPRHPGSNGVCERINRSLCKTFGFCQWTKRQWSGQNLYHL